MNLKIIIPFTALLILTYSLSHASIEYNEATKILRIEEDDKIKEVIFIDKAEYDMFYDVLETCFEVHEMNEVLLEMVDKLKRGSE